MPRQVRYEAMPRASVVRHDVSRAALSHARERVCRATDGARQTTADPIARGGAPLGAPLHRRSRGGTRSPSPAITDAEQRTAQEGRRLSRRLLAPLRQAGGPAQFQVGAEPRRRPEGLPRRAAARRAGGTRRYQSLQDRIGLRRPGRGRDDEPRAGDAARGDQLGDGAVAAPLQEITVQSLWSFA